MGLKTNIQVINIALKVHKMCFLTPFRGAERFCSRWIGSKKAMDKREKPNSFPRIPV